MSRGGRSDEDTWRFRADRRSLAYDAAERDGGTAKARRRKRPRCANRLHVAGDGVEAMAFLRRQGKHAGAPRPDLVLLDLNLPRMDGREVLAQIKGDPELRTLPVIVLTTSDAEADVLKSYDSHANCYLVKPVDVDQFFAQVRSLEGFWLAVVKLPPEPVRAAA